MTMPQEIPISNLNPHLGIEPYNAPAVITFSVIGLLLQIPVISIHCGLNGRPNIPVVLMSIFYVYFMLSTTMSAAHWSTGDPSQWWNGAGWCDFDVRMNLALSLGALATQCVINWNIIELLQDRPQIKRNLSYIVHIILELLGCLFLPVLNFAVSTFTMTQRYEIMQDFGCAASLDSSVALVITNFMWIPILGAIAFFTMIYIAYRFYKRGKETTMEKISFIPNMSPDQFLRVIIFATFVTFILMPLSICVAVINFISLHRNGIQELAWAHGKPSQWDNIMLITLDEIAMVQTSLTHATLVVNFITRYINIAIAWILFICYGTGVIARAQYVSLFRKVLGIRDPDSKGTVFNDDDIQTETNSKCEWDTDYTAAKSFKDWESSLDRYHQRRLLTNSTSSQGSDTEVSPSRGPMFPLRDLMAGKGLFNSQNDSRKN